MTADTRDAAAHPRSLLQTLHRLHRWWRGRLAGGPALAHSASLSYRYLARQIAVDLPYAEGGKIVLFSAPGSIELINEALLMFACFARDELGCRLLIVDGTLMEGGVTASLGYDGVPGFVELICGGEYRLPELIQPTNRPGISVLPAGRPLQHTLSAAQIAQAAQVFEEARRGYDYVLLQQASILTDSRYLLFTGLTDLLLLVVEEGGTPVEELDRCRKLFRDHQISNVRLLLAAAG